MIFDVGANVGQSATLYGKRFPASTVFSFEPAADTFRHLQSNTTSFRNIRCFNVAFAAKPGMGFLAHGATSDLNKVVSDLEACDGADLGACERTRQETIDEFCAEKYIRRIDYLKIDAEGADLDIIRGAERMLRQARVSVIEVEVGVAPENQLHVPLHELKLHLEQREYLIFGFYEQTYEWKRRLSHLRRANVVFIARSLSGLP